MKNKLSALTALITLLFFSSCQLNFEDTETYKSASSDGVTIIVKSQDNSINFASNSSSRTIFSETLPYNNLHFYLWGKNRITGENLTVTKTEFNPSSDSTTGTININQLSSSNYELYLGATKEEVQLDGVANDLAILHIKSKLFYIGLANADLRYTSQVIFMLTPYAVSGNGKVSLKLYFPWFDAAQYPSHTITAALYDLNTNAVIRQQFTAENGAIHPYSTVNLEVKTSVPQYPNYQVKEIQPGNYNFKVIFENNINHKKYIWSDIIQVLANRETSAVIEVPNILLKSYIEAPTDLVAFYSLPESSVSDAYPVEFCWTDNSDNEFNFQLELIDLSTLEYDSINSGDAGYNYYVATLLDNSKSVSEKDAAWDYLEDYKGSISFTPDDYGDSSVDAWHYVCSNGSLLSNSSYVVYNFKLGKRYVARICATNEVGSSSYAYANINNSNNISRKRFENDGSFHTWASGSTAINLYRITYSTNGGNFYDDATPSSVVSSVPLCEYDNQKSALSHSILNAINYAYASGKSASLKTSSGTSWSSWKTIIASGIEFTPTNLDYTGFESLDLVADYSGESAESIVQFSVNNEVLIYGGRESDVNGVQLIGIQPTFTIDEETCQLSASVSRTQYKRLWFYIRNPELSTNSNRYKFSDISMIASDKYGIPFTCEENRVTYDVEYPHFSFDFTNSQDFPAGWYYATLTLTPTLSPTNKIYVTVRFEITD